MPKLATLIDDMDIPEFPTYFSESERDVLLLAISAAKQRSRPYSGEYKAPWLLVDFDANEWKTTNRGREELINGVWHNTVNVNWAIALPNGRLLTDPNYYKLLNLNKRIAFLIRSGHVSNITAPVTWKAIVSVLLQFTRWVVLHESQFQPQEFGYKLVDQFSLNHLLRSLAQGGWTEAQQIPQRLLAKFYESAFKAPCPQNVRDAVYDLPSSVRTEITMWLISNDCYGTVARGVNKGKSYLKRDRLADEIGGATDSMKASAKLNAFCRQFEPDLQMGTLLVSIFQDTEKPDHKTKEIKDIVSTGAAVNTLNSVAAGLTTILSAHRHTPNFVPEPELISIREAYRNALTVTRHSGHNLFIPIEIGLAYFNNAMRFVHQYGDALVDYYLAILADRAAAVPDNDRASIPFELSKSPLSQQFKVFVNGKEDSIGSILRINEFRRASSSVDYDLLRMHPTLDEALRVLIGSCIVCIALMKPSRDDELTHLKRDCLLHNGDGYYFRFKLGKSNARETYQELDRPIPVITAKAIQLMQKLGLGLVDIFKDNRKISDNLFYLPNDRGDGALKADSKLLNSQLDVFCDYVGLDTDDLGRRWYVRIHEMRKWFLLLLFWSGKYDVLDAARWMAGHTDASHVYAYIEQEFPGEELPKLEAEYAIERLRAIEAAGDDKVRAESGLDRLYEVVLNHFKASSLSLVPDSDWEDFVMSLRESEGFSLEPHSIFSETDANEVIGINVSFVMREI